LNKKQLRWTFRIDGSEIPTRELVGGKAWSIARMSHLELRVPPAFVVTTDAYRRFRETSELWPELLEEIEGGLEWLGARTGRRFGACAKPLLVSVRSGAAVSMPGMMDTVLNLGVHATTRAGLTEDFGNPDFVEDTHRRFLNQYANIVLGASEEAAANDLGALELEDHLRKSSPALPADPRDQLCGAVRAVFESWQSRRARRYRDHHGIDHALGTAVTIQAMVFGNMDEQSGTGVVFTRNPLSGDPLPYGEFLVRAQGEDVVSGRFTPSPLSHMRKTLPDAYNGLMDACDKLEQDAAEIQDIEFTVERGQLYVLQSRAAKLSPAAAVRTSVDLVREGYISEDAALRRLKPEGIKQLLLPTLSSDTVASAIVVARGEGACPGIGIGVVVGDADEAERRAKAGEKVVLARPTTSPSDLHGMITAVAVITEEGGSTSHAAVVSRALGRPCVVGCGAAALIPDLLGRTVTVEGGEGIIFQGALPLRSDATTESALLREVHRWAERRSRLRVIGALDPKLIEDCLDLDEIVEASDPTSVATALSKLYGQSRKRFVRGGAIGSSQGIQAAIALGVEAIVCEPVLPALIAAAQLSVEGDDPARRNVDAH
jgi:pyruvate, orthophosphate dikinase